MEKKFYTSERNVQIILSLLKAHNIKKIVASPGTTNFTFVGSVQDDPYFEVWSAFDERSAAYMACGIAAESGEPVVLTCTGATASRDYYPGLSEAYYRKLPILAITSHQGKDRIGHLIPQNIDRSQIPHDIARLSVELPVVKDERDEAFVTMEANKAVLELFRGGGGPVHVNLFTTYSKDFSVKELPPTRIIHRYFAWDKLPEIPAGKVAVYVGSHRDFSKQQNEAIERFCATFDAVVICDHTSGYYGKYKLLPTLAHLQTYPSKPIGTLDLMIHIGEVCAASFAGTFKTKQIWRVSEDGELRDPYSHLTNVFQMSEEFFFNQYGKTGKNHHDFIDKCNKEYDAFYDMIPELPFCNIWAASQMSRKLPENSLLHISVSNTRRCWNLFHLPKGVTSACNVGCCGIDGCTSTMVGASLVNSDRITYLVTGDLAFFYDLNSIFNRHVGRNVRIFVVNNGGGAEFQLYKHPCYTFGTEAREYMGAFGHNGNKSQLLLKNIAEGLGFEYMAASTKEEFMDVLPRFTESKLTERPMMFEIFTNAEDENDALKRMSSIKTDAESLVKSKLSKGLKSLVGESGVNKLKNLFK